MQSVRGRHITVPSSPGMAHADAEATIIKSTGPKRFIAVPPFT